MLTIHNMWTGDDAPQMYLWLEFKSDKSSGVLLDGVAPATETYIEMTSDTATLTWDTVNAGNLSFVTFKDNKVVTDDDGNDVKWSINDDATLAGFIEFTQIADDTGTIGTIWADLSNVDGVGLLCGLSGLPESEGATAGFKDMQTTFVGDLEAKFPTLPDSAKPTVEIAGTTYTKVIAPGKSGGDSEPWADIIGMYYDKIIGVDRDITLTIPNADNGNWTGKQYGAGTTITGQGLDDVPMAVHISSTFSSDKSDPTIPTYTYDVYIAKSVWTSATISKADGSHAVYVRTDNPALPEFQPVPNKPDGSPPDDPHQWGTMWSGQYGYDSMGINPVLSTSSTQPYPIPAIAFAISRICAVIQSGYINDANSDPIVYPDDTSGTQYGGNLYNDWILANSNSYGQPYSDGQAQVLYHPPSAFELFILAPDAADTGSYFVPGGGGTPSSGAVYQLTIGGGADAAVDTLTFGELVITGDNGAFMIPGDVMNPDDWVDGALGFTAGGTVTWKFKLQSDPADYTSAPVPADTVQPSTGLVWQATGNTSVPWNLVSGVLTPP